MLFWKGEGTNEFDCSLCSSQLNICRVFDAVMFVSMLLSCLGHSVRLNLVIKRLRINCFHSPAVCLIGRVSFNGVSMNYLPHRKEVDVSIHRKKSKRWAELHDSDQKNLF